MTPEERLRQLLADCFRVDDLAACGRVSPEMHDRWMAHHSGEYDALVAELGQDTASRVVQEESRRRMPTDQRH